MADQSKTEATKKKAKPAAKSAKPAKSAKAAAEAPTGPTCRADKCQQTAEQTAVSRRTAGPRGFANHSMRRD